MDNRTFLICILVVAAIVAAVYFVSDNTINHYQCEPDLISKALPTSPEVEYIEGHPDMHIVNHDDVEIIPHGDLTLSPGFGVGAGLVGFGRSGNTMMA